MRQGVPPCPLHAKRHVTRNGHYDDPGRQLWWCTPGGGEAPHAFAGSLPRQAGDPGHTCPSCEADLEEHQGPPSPPTSTCPPTHPHGRPSRSKRRPLRSSLSNEA